MARTIKKQSNKPVHVVNLCVICGDIAGFGFSAPGPINHAKPNKTKWFCYKHKKDGEKAYAEEFLTSPNPQSSRE